ncbi:hypothetical protein OURE66S_03973 [Oligella ureolytica]
MSQSQSTAVQDQNNLQPGDKKVSEWKRFSCFQRFFRVT